MTKHAAIHPPLVAQHSSDELANAAVATRAGRMSLRIAEIGARQSEPGALAEELASYVRAELGADAVALYRCHQRERRRGGASPQLRLVGGACGSSSASQIDDIGQRLKASGYRALSRNALVVRSGSGGGEQLAVAVPLTLALPLGAPVAWAVLVARWDAPSSTEFAEIVGILDALRAPLALATRPAQAQAEDAAARANRFQPPRRAVFAVTSEAIITLDDEFTIREINPAFTTILGWSEQAAVGRRCSEVLRCRDDRRMLLCGTPRCPLHEAFSASAALPVRELTWETEAGKSSEVAASFAVQQATHQMEAIVVARDVTLLNAANRMRANFISMVSHELRTPLNSINGFLEIVLESPVGPLNERQREFLNYARVSTQQLTTLVEDILFISKADSGQFTLRRGRVRVPKVVDSALQAVWPAAEKAQVRIVTELPPGLPVLRADELRIQQVLTNLLSNAVKFSPPESTVRLTVSVRDAALRFAVSDEGKGIVPEDHARIFERFYQSDSNVRNRAGGYGLGLSIAKLIVEQHAGHIWVESQPGEGATFYFTLPLGTSEAGFATNSARGAPAS
ncbi:MAG: ATP-binding protein [Ktedonobacterales bacterium]